MLGGEMKRLAHARAAVWFSDQQQVVASALAQGRAQLVGAAFSNDAAGLFVRWLV